MPRVLIYCSVAASCSRWPWCLLFYAKPACYWLPCSPDSVFYLPNGIASQHPHLWAAFPGHILGGCVRTRLRPFQGSLFRQCSGPDWLGWLPFPIMPWTLIYWLMERVLNTSVSPSETYQEKIKESLRELIERPVHSPKCKRIWNLVAETCFENV